MSDIQRNLLIGCAIAAVIAGGVYMVWYRNPASLGSTPGATTTVSGITGTGSYTVEQANVTPPSLDKPIVITASSSLSAENQKVLRTMIEAEIALLRKEPTRVDLWLQLGVDRKIGGDYAGAIEAWEYVAQAAPKTLAAVAHADLADLYMYFLKDYAKAETRYNQAIVLNPNVIESYRALFYLYKDIYKDPAKARAVVDLGLKNNPGNKDLLNLQSLLK